jgi:hypothetical protein
MSKCQATKLLLAFALLAGASFSTQATIITFDGLAGTAMLGNSIVGTTFTGFAANTPATVDGFQFSSSGPEYFLGAAYAAACCASDFGPLAYNGTDYLIGLPDISVNKVGGGAFALNGFDLSKWDGSTPVSITLTTIGPSGATTQTLPLSPFLNSFINTGDDFSHFSLAGYDNAVSFTLTGNVTDRFIAIDNVNISDPVPEPETYAMLLAGLGFIVVMVRHKKHKETAAAQ